MKPGAFTQFYIQLVFSPKHRDRLLVEKIRPRIFEYLSGITTNLGHKSIIINGVTDHNQEQHHRKQTFKEEYIEFLNKYEMKFEEQYLFEFFD